MKNKEYVTNHNEDVDFIYNKVDRLPINGDVLYIHTVTGQQIGEHDTVVSCDYEKNTYKTQFYTVTMQDKFDVLEFDNRVNVNGITYVKENNRNLLTLINSLQDQLDAVSGNVVMIGEELKQHKHNTHEAFNDIGEELSRFDEALESTIKVIK